MSINFGGPPGSIWRSTYLLWWIAGADRDKLSQMPRGQRLKYSALGSLVIATTSAGTVGWFFEGSRLFLGLPYAEARSAALAAGMSALLLLFERLLILTIQPRISALGKFFAFAWRSFFALANATILTLPMALFYFTHGIDLTLQKEALDTSKLAHAEINDTYGVPSLQSSVGSLTTAMTTLRVTRDQYPIAVQEKLKLATTCEAESKQFRATIFPEIEAGLAVRKALNSKLEDADSESLRARLQAITLRIGNLRSKLFQKDRDCGQLRRRSGDAIAAYHNGVDSQYKALSSQEQLDEQRLSSAVSSATRAQGQTDIAIQENAIPDLGAQVRGLIKLLCNERIDFGIFLVFFGVAFMLDMMPVIYKLTLRSTEPYGKSVTAEEDIFVAEVDAEVAAARSSAAIRIAKAQAEQAGFKRFCAEDNGEIFARAAQDKTRFEFRNDSLIREGLGQVHLSISEFIKLQRRLDEITQHYANRPDVLRDIEEIREVFREMMRESSADLRQKSAREAAE